MSKVFLMSQPSAMVPGLQEAEADWAEAMEAGSAHERALSCQFICSCQ